MIVSPGQEHSDHPHHSHSKREAAIKTQMQWFMKHNQASGIGSDSGSRLLLKGLNEISYSLRPKSFQNIMYFNYQFCPLVNKFPFESGSSHDWYLV